jgi:hypothetical protein
MNLHYEGWLVVAAAVAVCLTGCRSIAEFCSVALAKPGGGWENGTFGPIQLGDRAA